MELVSTAKAAEILSMTQVSVANRIKAGKLTARAKDGSEWVQGTRIFVDAAEVEALRDAERALFGVEAADWITASEAALILGTTHFHAMRLAGDGLVIARMGREPGLNGRSRWFFSRRSIEERAERMKQEPDDPDWIPIREAKAILGMSRFGIRDRIQSGVLESKHFGPAEQPGLFLRRSQCEAQRDNRPTFPRRTDWPELSAIDAERAWFAGFFDGEGCVYIRRPNNRARTWMVEISVVNSSIEAIRKMQEILGGRVYPRPRQKPHYRDQERWSATGEEACAVLKAILPYMIAKKLQAEIAIEFQDRIRQFHFGRWDLLPDEEVDWRNQQCDRISRLNRPNVER